MVNKYLEKIAGMPGSFMAAAKKSATGSISANTARTNLSGLHSGPNVSKAMSPGPKVVQNRTGMDRSPGIGIKK